MLVKLINIGKTAVTIYQGVRTVIGILQVIGVDILTILPFLAT